jgi:hypothetical protein
MNAKVLCNWLGIADWPPDHYSLLGLKPGQGDAARVEQLVQERLAKLRCYQLSYPEEATEGMNRLAQAFISLTEAMSRSAPAAQKSNGTPMRLAAATMDTQQLLPVSKDTEINWRDTPPPVRLTKDAAAPAAKAPATRPSGSVPVAAPVPEDVDPETLLARDSVEARRGLGTLPALIERIGLTRAFLLAWNQAGKYLSDPAKKLTRSAEDGDLLRRLNKVFELTADFPAILGHPGQPGYRVAAMGRLQMTAEMFKMLDKNQRLELARDWHAGQRVLLAHRRYLRAQFKLVRRRGPVRRTLEAIRGALNDHPGWVATGVLVTFAACLYLFWQLF